MSRIGISFCKVMIPVGIMILLIPNIVAKKQPAVVESGRDLFMDRGGACLSRSSSPTSSRSRNRLTSLESDALGSDPKHSLW